MKKKLIHICHGYLFNFIYRKCASPVRNQGHFHQHLCSCNKVIHHHHFLLPSSTYNYTYGKFPYQALLHLYLTSNWRPYAKLKHFEEAFTSERWIVRIYKVLPLPSMDPKMLPRSSKAAKEALPKLPKLAKPPI